MTEKHNPTSPAVDYVLDAFVLKTQHRKKVYGGFVAVGLLLTAVITYFGATGMEVPAWIIGGNAVYNMLSSTGFVLAIGNTKTQHLTVETATVDTADDAEEVV